MIIRWKCAAVFLVMLVLPLKVVATEMAFSVEPSQISVRNGDYGVAWISKHTSFLVEVRDSVMDGAGNVYSIGSIDDGSSYDIVVIKHGPQGELLWTTPVVLGFDCVATNGASLGCDDRGVAIALDSSGSSVYIAGDSHNMNDYDIVVGKYATADGAYQGGDRYAGAVTIDANTVATDDRVVDLVVGAGDQIYIVGTTKRPASYDSDIVTLRVATTGQLSWARVYPDPALYPDEEDNDRPVAAGVDAAGNVMVAATMQNDLLLLKYNVAGGLDYAAVPPTDGGSRADQQAKAMVIDGDGYVYITGWSYRRTSEAMKSLLTVKFDGATGQVDGSWQDAPFTRGQGSIEPIAMTVDVDDRVYIAAREGDANSNYLTLKLTAAGGVDWAAVYDQGIDDAPRAIAVDSAANVYVTGAAGSLLKHDIVTLIYDANGVRQDIIRQDFSVGDDLGVALNVGVDANNVARVVVLGSSSRGKQSDFIVAGMTVMHADLKVLSLTASLIDGVVLWPYDVSISLAVEVANIRDALAGKLAVAEASTLGIYLSTTADPTLGTLTRMDDLSFSIAALESNQSTGLMAKSWVVDSTVIGLGDYWLVAIADDGGVIVEADEANVWVGPQLEVINPPDLKMVSVEPVMASVLAGNSVIVDYIISNLRPSPAAEFEVGFILSRDTTVDAADAVMAPISGHIVSGLAGNTVDDPRQATVTIPPDLAPGLYFIAALADVNNIILEANKMNNTVASETQLDVLAIPNLLVNTVSPLLGGQVGLPFQVDFEVSNEAGNGNVQELFDVAVYLSLDLVIDPAEDHFLGSYRVTSDDLLLLAAGEFITGIVSGDAPVVDGLYYVGAIVDAAAEVLENNEQDNVGVASYTTSIGLAATTTGAKPDLVVAQVGTALSSVTTGVTIIVTAKVENVTPAPVPSENSFVLGIYISTDADITTTDMRLGETVLAGIAGLGEVGAIVDTSVEVTLPGNVSEPVEWTNLVYVTVGADNTLTGNFGNWGAGASSVQRMAGDGDITVVASETDTTRVFGFNYDDLDINYKNIDYSIMLKVDGTLSVRENGTGAADLGAYVVGTNLRIERRGTVVYYFKNGDLEYTSVIASSGEMLVDVSFSQAEATIKGAVLTRVLLPPGDYYLGAIIDDTDAAGLVNAGGNRVDEMNESNNSKAMTDSATGEEQSVLVSVIGAGADADGRSGGGMAFLLEIFLLLLWSGVVALRRYFTVFGRVLS